MTRSSRGIGGAVVITLVLVASGCATRPHRGGFNCDREWGWGTVGGAVAGAMVGGGTGGGIVATSGETERQAEDYATAIGIGAVSGALIGGLFGHCAFDPLHAPPPPPPSPPPPPPAPPAKKKIVLRGVNFDFDKATIRRDAVDVLDEAAHILRERAEVDVAVDGHTDAMGTDEYNQRLSERRSNSVLDYLVGKGVSSSRLSAKGFGESSPIATNETGEGRALNRRVELRLQ